MARNILYEQRKKFDQHQTNIKNLSRVKKLAVSLGVSGAMVASLAVPAFAMGGPTPNPVGGPGCFGKWRAGSVQSINGHAPGTNNAGALYFSSRAATNSSINASNRETCAAQ